MSGLTQHTQGETHSPAIEDRALVTAVLVVLSIGVQLAAIWMVADPLQAVEASAPIRTAENKPETAGYIGLLLIAELAVVVLGWAIYRRLPAWVQRWVRRGLLAAVIVYALLYALLIMPILFIVIAAVIVISWVGYSWLAYDIVALTLGVVIAATLGGYVGPIPIIILILGLITYDYIAVMKTDTMDRFVRLLSGMGLPVMVIIPKHRDIELRVILDSLTGEGIDVGAWKQEVYTIVGVGDFAIPAALTVAVFRHVGLVGAVFVMAGTVAGMLALGRDLGDRPLPGLPYVGTGAIAGYGPFLVGMAGGLS